MEATNNTRKTVKAQMTSLLEQLTSGSITPEQFAVESAKIVNGEPKVIRKEGEVFEKDGIFYKVVANQEGKLTRPKTLGSLEALESELFELKENIKAIKSLVK